DVLARARDVGNQRGVATPQTNVVTDSRAMDRECRSPTARSEYGNPFAHRMRSPIRRSLLATSRPMLERCRKRISALDPIDAAMTCDGAPDSHAIGGSASVAATEPNDTSLVSHTPITNTVIAASVASGASTLNTPAATATPLPP